MITLTFASSEVRHLLIDNSSDRLAYLLLDQLLPRDAVSEYKQFLAVHRADGLNCIRQGLKEQPANKINHIKMVRELSRNNPAYLAYFPYTPSCERPVRDCLGLAEAKTWVEKNWDELIK